MLSRLISGVCKLFRSNSMPCRTHVHLDLQRWDCRKVSHAHQVVGCAGEGEDPVHFAHSAMPHFAQQGDRLQPTETLFDALSLLLTETIAGMLCRASVDCAPTAPCQVLRHMGVTPRCRHSATKSRVSKPLSPPTVTGFVPGICSSITSAASRSAVPLATNTSAATISPLRFSTNRFPL